MGIAVEEKNEGLLLVRLNRPDKRNSLTRAMLERLIEIFAGVSKMPGVRVMILTGTGEKAFSAGTDIAELASMNVEEARRASSRGQEVCEQIEQCGVPVIAAVNGLAAGGGCELALACHIRLASTTASFSLPEVKLGVIPGYGGTQRLARAAGSGRALEIMLTGAAVSADDALRVGLVNRVVASSQLLSEAETLAHEIASLAPLAIRACLEAVTRGLTLPLAEGLELEAKLFSGLFATGDMREGTRAFLEKRSPVFKGE
jgi:enoyl-CoA hydratase